eukprot:15441140-Alexandrium_andersonii.AAC.1
MLVPPGFARRLVLTLQSTQRRAIETESRSFEIRGRSRNPGVQTPELSQTKALSVEAVQAGAVPEQRLHPGRERDTRISVDHKHG